MSADDSSPSSSLPSLPISPPAGFDAQPLLHLLGATKPDTVDGLITDAFRLRSSGLDATTAQHWRSQLNKSTDEVQQVSSHNPSLPHHPSLAHLPNPSSSPLPRFLSQLFVSLASLLRMAVFHSSIQTKAAVAALFPTGFHPSLVALLSKLIAAHLAAFRQAATSSLPSPPLLRSFSTSVHTRASSSLLHHLNSPTIFLHLSLQQQPTRYPTLGTEEAVEELTCELKAEALKTMLSGLEKIQQQLAAMQ